MKRSHISKIGEDTLEPNEDQSRRAPGANYESGMAIPQDSDINEVLGHLKLAAEKGTASIRRTVEQNPTLALAGLVAIGALAGLAVHQRRTRPQSLARQVQRDMLRHSRSLRQAIREELRDSRLSDKYAQLSSSLSSIDWKPFIQQFLERASAVAEEAKSKLASVSR